MRLTRILFVVCIIVSGPTVAAAQFEDRGRLNSWGTSEVSRQNHADEQIFMSATRAAVDKGYERIVFQFRGGVPGYVLRYEKGPRFETTGEQSVRVRGRDFIHITFAVLPYPSEEKDPALDVRMPTPTKGMRVLSQVKELEWFEGYREIVLGLNSKARFRVQELKSPDRVVIDLKR